jgi:uncharacterized membrane protein
MPEQAPLKKDGKGGRDPRKIILLTYLGTTAASLIWLGGLLLAPYLKSRSSPWAGLAYLVYRPVCHQIPGRSFHCFGHPLAVCARCTGIYLGCLLGLVIYPFLRGWRSLSFPSSRVFFLLTTPIGLDTAANFLKLWATGNAVRMATGIIWGTILPFYFIPGIADLILSRKKPLEISPVFPLE